MPASKKPNLGLWGDFDIGQDNWGAQMNQNLCMLDAMIHPSVLGFTATLPASGAPGDRWILTTDNNLYAWDSGWQAFIPKGGQEIYDSIANTFYYYDGSDWLTRNSLLPSSAVADSRYFKASKSSDEALVASSTTQIIFDSESEDVSSSYNDTTGFFTAPEAGVYSFKYSFVIASAAASASSITHSFYDGSNDIAFKNEVYTGQARESFSNSVDIRLATAQTIGVRVTDTGGISATISTTDGAESIYFTGYKISI